MARYTGTAAVGDRSCVVCKFANKKVIKRRKVIGHVLSHVIDVDIVESNKTTNQCILYKGRPNSRNAVHKCG